MTSVLLLIWVIGAWFTCGVMCKDFDSNSLVSKFTDTVIVLISWPLLLGVFLREWKDG